MNADYTINRRQVQKITNPADLSALTLALEWKKRVGGEVICLTMGPVSAADCLREAVMSGADAMYHVCDPGLAGADTFVTAKVLATAIGKIGNVDQVFCGNQTVDGETGQVGAEVATMMGWACLNHVARVLSDETSGICCECISDGRTEVYSVRRPAVLCVCACSSNVTLPSLTAVRRANTMPVRTFALADLDPKELSGKRSSPTKVCAIYYMDRNHRHTVWLHENAAETIAEIFRRKAAGQHDR